MYICCVCMRVCLRKAHTWITHHHLASISFDTRSHHIWTIVILFAIVVVVVHKICKQTLLCADRNTDQDVTNSVTNQIKQTHTHTYIRTIYFNNNNNIILCTYECRPGSANIFGRRRLCIYDVSIYLVWTCVCFRMFDYVYRRRYCGFATRILNDLFEFYYDRTVYVGDLVANAVWGTDVHWRLRRRRLNNVCMQLLPNA